MCNVYPCGMDVSMNQTELFQECTVIGHTVNSQRLIYSSSNELYMRNRVATFQPSDFRRTATFRADGKSRFQDLAIEITRIIIGFIFFVTKTWYCDCPRGRAVALSLKSARRLNNDLYQAMNKVYTCGVDVLINQAKKSSAVISGDKV